MVDHESNARRCLQTCHDRATEGSLGLHRANSGISGYAGYVELPACPAPDSRPNMEPGVLRVLPGAVLRER